MALLARAARALGIPVIGTEQVTGLGPDIETESVRVCLTLAKMHFDACADGLVQGTARRQTKAVMSSSRRMQGSVCVCRPRRAC